MRERSDRVARWASFVVPIHSRGEPTSAQHRATRGDPPPTLLGVHDGEMVGVCRTPACAVAGQIDCGGPAAASETRPSAPSAVRQRPTSRGSAIAPRGSPRRATAQTLVASECAKLANDTHTMAAAISPASPAKAARQSPAPSACPRNHNIQQLPAKTSARSSQGTTKRMSFSPPPRLSTPPASA